jgi:hypothetical protein
MKRALLLSLSCLILSCQGSKPESPAPSASAVSNAAAYPDKPAQPPAVPSVAGLTGAGLTVAAEKPSVDAVASALSGAAPPSGAAGKPGVNAAQGATSVVSGPVAKGEGFQVHLEAQDSYAVGTPSSVKVVLKATPPFHCNDKYPYKFTPSAGPGLTFKEPVARGMNIAPGESTMDIGFTASQAGSLTVGGELSFSVCTEDRCLVEKQVITVTVNVKGAS